MTTCVCSPSRDAYSETFIRAHIDRLPGKTIALFEGWPVWEHQDRRVIPLPWRLAMHYGDRIHPWIGTTSSKLGQKSVAAFLRRHGVDAVLAEYGDTAVSLIEPCERARVPLVAHFHGYDAYHKAILAEQKEGYPRLFRSAAALIAVSRHMEQQLLALGAPRDKLFYNPYGVDLQHFSQTDPALNPPHFLAVGRFVDKKAPHLTLLAFEQAVRAQPEARLTFAGDGYLLDACQQMTRALGLSEQVRFLGQQTPAQVGDLMRASRAFVQHSVVATSGDSEGTPVSILEACASGLPVVATRHAGIPDVIQHRESGWLVEERDIHGMAEGMIELSRRPELAREWGARARAHVATHHAMDRQIGNLAAILEGSVKRQK